MANDLIDQVAIESPKAVDNKPAESENVALETLILLINAERLKNLQEKTEKEFDALRERQQWVADLHEAIKAINLATDANGGMDITNNIALQDLLEKNKEFVGDAAKVLNGKMVFTKDEKERLVENLKMSAEDLNVQNDMQLQAVSRLTNERYESYQLARSILKSLQDAKTSLAKALRG